MVFYHKHWHKTHTHTHVHKRAHIHTHTHNHVHTHTHTNNHVHTNTYTHVHTHTHNHVHTHIHTHTPKCKTKKTLNVILGYEPAPDAVQRKAKQSDISELYRVADRAGYLTADITSLHKWQRDFVFFSSSIYCTIYLLSKPRYESYARPSRSSAFSHRFKPCISLTVAAAVGKTRLSRRCICHTVRSNIVSNDVYSKFTAHVYKGLFL